MRVLFPPKVQVRGLQRCYSRKIQNRFIVPGGVLQPEPEGRGLFPPSALSPTRVFFAEPGLLEKKRIVPRRPKAGGAGVLPA